MPVARTEECLDENTIAELSEGRLPADRLPAVEAHVDGCSACRELVVSVSRSAAPTEPRSPLMGEVVADKYRVDEVIGSGGMGVVFGATHLLLDRKVALKVMNLDALSSRDAVERFMREARAAVRLQSDHATRVLDLGTVSDGSPYIVMERLEGEDLGRRVAREGALAVDIAVSYVAQACEAIGEAHGLGIVHRDLKPSNLFLTRDANGGACVKVLDFGLSKTLSRDRNLSLTDTRAVVGSPFFMAPEQLLSSRQVDARADIWALGATLQFLITGRPPFEAVSLPELSAGVLRDAPLPLPPSVAPELSTVIARCLEKDPGRRIASAAELGRALAPFAAAPPRRPEVESLRSIAAPPIRRSSSLAIAAIVVGAVGLAVIAYLALRRDGRPPVGAGAPVVVLMDTPVARGVYDATTVAHGGTNADELSDRLRDLPVTLVKEAVPSTWNRESYILGLQPDLVVIHRSAFFHALNLEFGFGYPPYRDERHEAMWRLLYRTADDKLIVFLGLVGTAYPQARFLVYSRGTDGFWPDPAYRKQWIEEVEQRFPALRGRLGTMFIAGGVAAGTFSNPAVVAEIRGYVVDMLGLEKNAR